MFLNGSLTGKPYFVFANDADDIKVHPFFHGLDFNEVHNMKPPFVPKIRAGQTVTKYFEDEQRTISTSMNLSSEHQGEPRVRPRDKILRDPALSAQAMDLRKKTAFLGYTDYAGF